MHKLRFLCLFPILFTVDIDQSLRWYWFWYWGRQIQALWSVFHLWYWIIILQLYSHFRQIDCFFLFVFSLIDLFIITNSYFVENSLCLWIFLSDSVSVSLSFCLSIFLFLLLSLSLFLSLFLSLSLSLPPPPHPPPSTLFCLSLSFGLSLHFWVLRVLDYSLQLSSWRLYPQYICQHVLVCIDGILSSPAESSIFHIINSSPL